jgi:nicotinate-nucleotide adenylyltransferase
MKKDKHTYVFGGTFDPPHEGHLGVIKEVLKHSSQLVLAPTQQNPLKPAAETEFSDRVMMIELVLKYEGIAYSKVLGVEQVFLSHFSYQYAKDFVLWLRPQIQGRISWVVGPDIAEEVPNWKDWDTLDLGLFVAENYAENLHSSDVRDKSRTLHPALRDFVERKRLYEKSLR